MRNWDYGWNAMYFVTICTKNRVCYFGEIIATQNFASQYEMKLSEIGKLAHKCWLEIPEHFPFVILDEFVIMPNHVHGIIIINKPDGGDGGGGGVEAQNFAPLPEKPSKNKFGPQSKNLGSIIRGFKTGVTVDAHKINPVFAWQPRFHDHIIRNEESFQRIRNYIINNPANWHRNNLFDKP